MYRLVLYYLIGLLIVALVLSLLGILPYSPIGLAYSVFFITLLCYIVNVISAWMFGVPANVESVYITALILALIITPIKTLDVQYFGFVAWAAVWSQTSKYIFAVSRKHIFNPAAFAVALTAITINQSASWWVGTAWMLPFVLIGGFLTVRKIRRFDLVISFLVAAVVTILAFDFSRGLNISSAWRQILVDSPLFFFAFVMLTEPLTTPPTRGLQIIYGGLVGILFAPQIHILSIFSTPELALLCGNVFSYIVSPKKKLLLTLKQKIQLAPTIYDFVFAADAGMKFRAGQYLEWTREHDKSDNRGNRRYFTIASSPTEQEIIMGVKFYDPVSSYKKSLLAMQPGEKVLAGQLAGDFTLPKNIKEKSVFIAGGIGITPFRSMIKYLLDKNEKRDIVLFYSNKNIADVVYADIFDQAVAKLGLKVVYTLTDINQLPPGWQGHTGTINQQMIAEQVPDFTDRTFYISGPRAMVTAFEATLAGMGVHDSKIKTDFFPGFV